MKTFQKVLWVVAWLASEALVSGCKSGWWFSRNEDHKYKMLVIPPNSKMYVRPLPITPPIQPPVSKPELITPWNDGPVLAPTPLPPAEAPAPTPIQPKPSSRRIDRTAGEVVA